MNTKTLNPVDAFKTLRPNLTPLAVKTKQNSEDNYATFDFENYRIKVAQTTCYRCEDFKQFECWKITRHKKQNGKFISRPVGSVIMAATMETLEFASKDLKVSAVLDPK
jgi:hypothetical protein